ncbi:PEP-CTERM sorting domain-containing protein [Rubritalea tangerina]|uniref:PEP-CTERM sorting domain-containing protein n=2 Tax=Rubritalea tangerina TaxID=430798 RepID=A0ABW4Z6T0_9BACT
MKHVFPTLFVFPSLVAMASGATVTWDSSGVDGNWSLAAGWDTGNVPVLNGTDDAVIDNGAKVTYVPGGDFAIGAGSSLSISGGSTWEQTVSNWTRVNGGEISLDGGTLSRTVGGNLVLGFEDGTGGTVTLSNSASLSVGGELWFGRNDNSFTNQVANVQLSGGSSISAGGDVGIWFWDTDASGNSMNLDFISGTEVMTVSGRVGRRNSGGANNSVAWETLWNEGVLTIDGGNAGSFADHFVTSGTVGTTSYQLQSIPIPEPSTGVIALLGGGLLLRRRRR